MRKKGYVVTTDYLQHQYCVYDRVEFCDDIKNSHFNKLHITQATELYKEECGVSENVDLPKTVICPSATIDNVVNACIKVPAIDELWDDLTITKRQHEYILENKFHAVCIPMKHSTLETGTFTSQVLRLYNGPLIREPFVVSDYHLNPPFCDWEQQKQKHGINDDFKVHKWLYDQVGLTDGKDAGATQPDLVIGGDYVEVVQHQYRKCRMP
jgi:hypothetical protein